MQAAQMPALRHHTLTSMVRIISLFSSCIMLQSDYLLPNTVHYQWTLPNRQSTDVVRQCEYHFTKTASCHQAPSL